MISTLVGWIWSHPGNQYNVATKEVSFLRITEHTNMSNMQPVIFYKEFRASFLDNLREKGVYVGIKKFIW